LSPSGARRVIAKRDAWPSSRGGRNRRAGTGSGGKQASTVSLRERPIEKNQVLMKEKGGIARRERIDKGISYARKKTRHNKVGGSYRHPYERSLTETEKCRRKSRAGVPIWEKKVMQEKKGSIARGGTNMRRPGRKMGENFWTGRGFYVPKRPVGGDPRREGGTVRYRVRIELSVLSRKQRPERGEKKKEVLLQGWSPKEREGIGEKKQGKRRENGGIPQRGERTENTEGFEKYVGL